MDDLNTGKQMPQLFLLNSAKAREQGIDVRAAVSHTEGNIIINKDINLSGF